MSDDAKPRLHPSAQLGLLRYLTESAIDGDYELVARRNPTGRKPGRGVLATVIAVAFGFMVMLSFVQTSQGQAVEESGREDLIRELRTGRTALETKQARAVELRAEVADLRAKVLNSTALSQRTRRDLERLGLAAGTTEAHGQGVVITVDDAEGATHDRERVLDIDLQRLVNGLWEAGAEAISINNRRLGPRSAIRQAGAAITVNYKSLDRPYVIRAIGDRGRLPARFAETASGRAWLDLQRRVNLQFQMRSVGDLTVPAVPNQPLRHARPVKEARS